MESSGHPIEVQRAYLKLAQQHLTPEERTPVIKDVLEKWQFVLDNLEIDPARLSRHLDWIIKKEVTRCIPQTARIRMGRRTCSDA